MVVPRSSFIGDGLFSLVGGVCLFGLGTLEVGADGVVTLFVMVQGIFASFFGSTVFLVIGFVSFQIMSAPQTPRGCVFFDLLDVVIFRTIGLVPIEFDFCF